MTENKNLKEFMTKLLEDEKLLKELQEAAKKDPINGAYNFALEHSGGGFTEDEFGEYLKRVLYACATKIKEMDESELENVAGGEEPNKEKQNAASNDEAKSTAVAYETGKWNAITAAINSSGSVARIFDTIANIWATWMARKDQKAQRQVQGAAATLQIEKYKAQLRNEYGYTNEQIDAILDQF